MADDTHSGLLLPDRETSVVDSFTVDLELDSNADSQDTWQPSMDDTDERVGTYDGWSLPPRYELLGAIASGGMGDVLRVRDRVMRRVVAMKLLQRRFSGRPRLRARFEREARVTGQLEHPGIVSVHDMGELPGGGLWFTMKEIRGRTLSSVIQELHAASTPDGWGATSDGFTLGRLVEAFARICEAVGYAHSRGVLHRDIKPSNLMVGPFGEVLVMDWGLARVADDVDDPETAELAPAPVYATRMGEVVGTPAYMSPEQALGRTHALAPTSDVFGLGATLFALLAGRPPFTGPVDDILMALRTESAPSLREVALPSLPVPPDALVDICEHAIRRQPDERPADASELGDAVRAWLDGTARRERARAVVERAGPLVARIDEVRLEARRLRGEAARRLDALSVRASVARKRGAWALEDRAEELEKSAVTLGVELEQAGRAALELDATLPDAHAFLADHYQRSLVDAEARHQSAEALRLEALLRTHDRGGHTAFLTGDGAVTLHTDPPGAEVRAFRYVTTDRRLTPVFDRVLGTTPLDKVPLPRGSWMLEVAAGGCEPVRYPVRIGRLEHWDGVRPGGSAPFPIRLPKVGELGPDDCYVPAGWFAAGGDPEAGDSLEAQQVWLDGFVMRRYPVTNREYLAFLNDLVATGRGEEAARWAPLSGRERSGDAGTSPYVLSDSGTYVLGRDGAGLAWQQDWPVVLVDWWSALAFAEWESQRTGRTWRLPDELEWEKSARGVDGRYFPWGDFIDPTWCRVVETLVEGVGPGGVESTPDDESPYGVCNMAGSVRTWCWNLWEKAGPPVVGGVRVPEMADVEDEEGFRSVRGGSWLAPVRVARSGMRTVGKPGQLIRALGLRLCAAVGPRPT